MNYSIKIDHDLRIIRYKHAGLIKKEEIEAAWGEFLQMKEFTHFRYNLLSDYRDGKFDIDLGEIPYIIEFMRAIENIVRGKRQALIIDDAYSTAGSKLFEIEVYSKVGFIVQLFSTEEAAVNWLI